ncbi:MULTISPECIES: amidase [unclassified Sinorhizobium]|uniref:amidase n=1 Tax=unclassified Sinorhizobium TaxID=2613772 RepID=UPI00352545AD
MPTELNKLTASEIARRTARGEISAREVIEACLDRIAEREDAIKAWSFIDRAQAVELAEQRDRMPTSDPLSGVPIGVKDVIDTADQPTSYNSPIYSSHRPKTDAASVALLKRAGALVPGKTVTTEFANVYPAATRNPHDVRFSPGGSSSGSAAAVADFMVPVALGTQTAGSTIRPAAYCGVFAIKPTFGSINRAGLKFLAESLDTIGIFSRTPEDLALVLTVLSGRNSVPMAPDRRPRIGIVQDEHWKTAADTTQANLELACERLARAGAAITVFAMPAGSEDLSDRHKSIMGFESARALAWEMDNFPDLLSDALKARLEDGWGVGREEYDAVRHLAKSCRRAFAQNMQNYDFLLTPSAPGEAPLATAGTGDSVFNRSWTLLGVPCVNVPFGLGPLGLPLGLQLIGKFDDDMSLIAWADWVHTVLPG